MIYLDDFILSIIFIAFPIICYLFYVAYNKNIGREENILVFCFSLFSSIYLLTGKEYMHFPRMSSYMSNITVIIAYLHKRPVEALIISIFNIFIVKYYFELNIYALIISNLLIFLIYLLKNKYNISDYLFVVLCYLFKLLTSLIFKSEMLYEDSLFITTFLSIMAALLVIYLMRTGDSILKYHIAYKELIQEKQIRTSLFKITHEIKNPLAVCKGYFEMLNIDDHEQCKKYLPIIEEEVGHVLYILNDFSDLSKIKVDKELIDVDCVLEETIKNLNEYIENKNVELVYEGGDELYIEGDYVRLMQVFINILKNSLEALEYKENKKIIIDVNQEKNKLCLVFKDSGCGMTKEVLEDFDKPFYTTKRNGTGLGTVISKEIIKAHGGEMTYNSSVNEGTEVYITLPKIATSFD